MNYCYCFDVTETNQHNINWQKHRRSWMSWPCDVIVQLYCICFVGQLYFVYFVGQLYFVCFVGQLYLVCFVCLEFDLNPFIKSCYVTHHHLSYQKISFAFSSRFDLWALMSCFLIKYLFPFWFILYSFSLLFLY